MESNIGRVNQVEEVSMLPHELLFIKGALSVAREQLSVANLEYGEAVASSGGDWAFDDSASKIAAVNAHIVEKKLMTVKKLSDDGTVIKYPEEESDIISIGTRVELRMRGNEISTLDVMAIAPLGIPEEENIEAISAKSPIGKSLLGTKLGDIIVWAGGNGKQFQAEVISINQVAQKNYYLKELGSYHEQ